MNFISTFCYAYSLGPATLKLLDSVISTGCPIVPHAFGVAMITLLPVQSVSLYVSSHSPTAVYKQSRRAPPIVTSMAQQVKLLTLGVITH